MKAPPGSQDILYGETPFGWRLSHDRSRLVVDPDECRLLAVVRHMYFIERMPMRSIVDQLDDLGVVNRRGRAFNISGVARLVHAPTEKPPEASARRRRSLG